MSIGETARLLAELDLQDNMSKGLATVGSNLDKTSAKIGKIQTLAGQGFKSAAHNIGLAGVALAGFVGVNVIKGVQSLEELDQLTRQTEAVITSTGGKAGVTAGQVTDLANSLENLTTVDDKVIRGGENMLLTFTNIGKDVFPDATKAIVNMAVAMNNGNAEGVDLQATAIQVGKALNDPIKGITALSKVGVTFTDQQKKQIAAMVEAGDVAGAQKVILGELATEFGKAGEAAGTGYAADMRRFNDAVEGGQQALARGFLPIIKEVTTFLTTELSDPKVISGIEDLGKEGAGLLKSGLDALKAIPWSQVGEAFKLMGSGAKAAADIFLGLPPWVQTAVLTGWGLNKLTGGALGGIVSELGKGLIKGVLGMNAAVVNINAGVVRGPGGLPDLVPAAGAAGAGAGVAGTAAVAGVVAAALVPLAQTISESETQRAAELKFYQQAYGDNRAYQQRNPYANNPSFQRSLQQPGGPAATGMGGLSSSGSWGQVAQSTTRTAEGVDELKRINQQAANQLGQMVAGVGAVPDKLSARLAAWAGSHDAAVAAGFKSGTEAIRREIASKLGITVDELRNLRTNFRTALATELGINTAELRRLQRSNHYDEQKVADALGISVDQLRALKEQARQTAANTTAIKNKDWKPQITIPVNVDTTFKVSARTLAEESYRQVIRGRPRVD